MNVIPNPSVLWERVRWAWYMSGLMAAIHLLEVYDQRADQLAQELASKHISGSRLIWASMNFEAIHECGDECVERIKFYASKLGLTL